MSEQRQHEDQSDGPLRQRASGADAGAAGAGADRLAEARGELDQLYAAADAILDGIRQGDSTRFLEQVRQSGGE